jgi:hypothetical protein
MPYDTYRFYQIERAKSPGEVQRADEQAARLASAVSSLFRSITRRAKSSRHYAPTSAPRAAGNAGVIRVRDTAPRRDHGPHQVREITPIGLNRENTAPPRSGMRRLIRP